MKSDLDNHFNHVTRANSPMALISRDRAHESLKLKLRVFVCLEGFLRVVRALDSWGGWDFGISLVLFCCYLLLLFFCVGLFFIIYCSCLFFVMYSYVSLLFVYFFNFFGFICLFSYCSFSSFFLSLLPFIPSDSS